MSESKTKQFLIICRTAPYSSSRISAALDLILTAATFDQEVRILFVGDGVNNLLSDQQSEQAGAKNFSKAFSAFELFGVKEVLVDEEDCSNLVFNKLVMPVKKSTNDEIKALLHKSDQVLVY